MSSSYIVEPQESGTEKKDDTLIIIVNDDGSLSVDQETLQSLIMNQSNANVSVVRVGQADTDIENGDITLTVDPPAFPPATVNSGGTDPTGLVDPFMEMDPEQLERLETALQSEEAKQILGENVTAMLDMLTVEEQQNSIRYSVKLDHCYTSRLSPSDPKPKDPLPVIDSPSSDDGLHYAPKYSPAPGTSKTASSTDTENMFLAKIQPKPIVKTSKPVGRPRKNIPSTPVSVCNNSRSSANITNTPKAVGHPVSRNLTDAMQHGIGKHPGKSNEEDEEELTSSSESSESEPSDNDSDFGPRGPRRGGIRARGGRKGLTTRGGSMAAARRRGSNKYMDMEQVRRLDMEMAAAVNAMKTPEKEDKSGFTLVRGRRQFKAPVGRKKDEPLRIESPSVVNEDVSPIFEKPLQTTNQVKANLINANMIKGDMILTKPGQGRNVNQKVTFVQKQVLLKPNDLQNVDIKKPLIIPKGKFLGQPGTKFFATKDGKLVQIPVTTKTVTTNIPVTPIKSPVPQASPTQTSTVTQTSAVTQNQTVNVQQPQAQQPVKVTSPTAVSKIKTYDLKKEKRKTENVETIVVKTEVEPVKTPENKAIDPSKKHTKKDNRKSPAYMVDSLGPALFSTPDIIRRVGSNGQESKGQENVVTSLISTTPSTVAVPTASTTPVAQVTASTSSGTSSCSAIMSTTTSTEQVTEGLLETPAGSQESNEPEQPVLEDDEMESKPDVKPDVSVDLTPALDSAGIEGEEHLLATLEMEASKHEQELLAEALLLQEELGVDLVENPTLGEEGGAVATTSGALASSNTMIISPLITSDQEVTKVLDVPATIIATTMSTCATTVETATVATTPAVATPVDGITITTTTVEAPTSVVAAAATTVTTSTIVTPMVVAANATTSQSAKETTKKLAKDDKEPIQIIRGGRVITLPPIEAPATRSKRLQVKAEPVKRTEKPGYNVQAIHQKSLQSVKHETYMSTDQNERNDTKIQIREGANEDVEEDETEGRNKKQIENVEDDDEEEEEEENSDSEDDPDRLWCICKRPHNNRFMICCDVCEDWFHGKCVHVSKAMGQQMEEKGIEWVCPNCTKKKEEEAAKAKLNVTQNASGNQRIQSDSDHSKNLDSVQTSFGDETATSLIQSDNGSTQYSTGMQCVVCKKEARNSSIYCSDACILAHAQETLTKDKPMPGSTASPRGAKSSPSDPVSKPKPDARVVVFERRTGRVLTGTDAPTRSNLRTWLKEHPTFEVVGTSNISSLQLGKIQSVQAQIPNKTGKSPLLSPVKGQNLPKMTYTKVQASKQMILTAGNKKFTVISTGQQPQPSTTKAAQMKQTILAQPNKSPLIFKTTTAKVVTPPAKQQQVSVASPKVTTPVKKQELKQVTVQSKQQQQQQSQVKLSLPKKPEPEPIRLNIRKTLTELLTSRIKETDDLKLTDEEIAELAFNIELEMYKYFKDTGAKYKAKYRSLVFNIKDTKNLTLFRKIADRSLTPDAVVRLSPDEMASQELAEWREKETKHQLEMIKKNELDLMAQAKSIVVKTHKGEQIIENDGGIDHVDPKTPVQDIVTALNSAENISSTVDDEKEIGSKMNDEDRLKLKDETKRSKGSDDKKRKDKEKEAGRGREKERDKDKDRGRAKDASRSKTSDRRDRSTSRGRHKRGRDDREHSKTREKSKERKSRDKESKREREKDRDRDRDRDRGPDRARTRDRDKAKTHESRSREKKQKDKDRDRGERDKERHRNSENAARNRNESKDADKKEEDRKRDTEKRDENSMVAEKSTDKSIDDRLWRHVEDEATTNTIDGNDSDVSDREPSSTVTIKTPDINDDAERERDAEPATVDGEAAKGGWQTVWRGFVNMVDVAKFFITAQEVSGQAKDLMDDLPDTVDVVGRISHETVWDYISKMKKTGSKEILVIRLTAANDEEKIPYITLYSYLNSRSRLGVVGNVSKNIKDFYIMPFSNQSTLPQVLLPLNGPGFEEHRPHLLLGIIVRNKRKRLAGIPPPSTASMKLSKKDDRSYTPPLVSVSKSNAILGAIAATSITTTTIASSSPSGTATSTYHKAGSGGAVELSREKQVTQTTLDSLNRAHIGMSRNNSLLDTAAICKIVPELSSKIDLTSSPGKPAEDDGDEPYSPGQMDEENASGLAATIPTIDGTTLDNSIISSTKNSNELQRKMDEINRQIEEQKQQIQSISSSFLGESTTTLPGLGLDPPDDGDCEEAYSPSDTRSFTPPPPGISKFTQPILEKVSNITIPPNLQEILANVKRQESSKVDPYLPSRPSASFLPTAYPSPSTAKHLAGGLSKPATPERASLETPTHRESTPKEKESNKSTLSSLSDLDLIRKAEEELAAVAAASAAAATTDNPAAASLTGASALPTMIGAPPPPPSSLIQAVPGNLSGIPSVTDVPCHETTSYKNPFPEPFKRNIAPEQPKPPGLEDEDFPPTFPCTPPNIENNVSKTISTQSLKFAPKSGIVLSVKRKVSDEGVAPTTPPSKTPRLKSRWGLGPSESDN